MTILKRKYPFESKGHWLTDCLINCAIVFGFLFFLQPFGFSAYEGSKLLASLGFTFVTFVCCVLVGNGLFRLCPRHVKTWRIWHHALSIVLLVLSIGIANAAYAAWLYHVPLSLQILLTFIYWSFLVGVFITTATIGIKYNRHLKHRMECLLDKTTEEQTGLTITFHDQAVRGDDLTIAVNDFLYAEALKNKVAIYYVDGGSVARHEIRQTLTAMLDGIEYDNVFQCHRSFVVNVNNITSAHGNSNGYRLTLGSCPTEVPVSRTYVPRLKSFIA